MSRNSYEQEYKKYKKLYLDEKERLGKHHSNYNRENLDKPSRYDYQLNRYDDKPSRYDGRSNRNDDRSNRNDDRSNRNDNKQTRYHPDEDLLDEYQLLGGQLLDNSNLERIRNWFNDRFNEDEIQKMRNWFNEKLNDPNSQKMKSWFSNIVNNDGKDLKSIKESEFALRDKFHKLLRNFKSNRDVDVDRYIEFAKNNNLLKSHPKDIIDKYSDRISEYMEKLENEKATNDHLISYLKIKREDDWEEDKRSSFPVSKRGYQCLSPCETRNDFFRGKYDACKTKEYNYWSGKYDWDNCEKDHDVNIVV